MSKILIKARSGDFTGELDSSAVSDTIWLSLPRFFDINMLGSMIYFECPVDVDVKGEQITKMKTGDIKPLPLNKVSFKKEACLQQRNIEYKLKK